MFKKSQLSDDRDDIFDEMFPGHYFTKIDALADYLKKRNIMLNVADPLQSQSLGRGGSVEIKEIGAVFVQVQAPGDSSADLRNLDHVGQSSGEVISNRCHEHLALVLETSK